HRPTTPGRDGFAPNPRPRQPYAVPPAPPSFTRANTRTQAGLYLRRTTSRARTAIRTRLPRRLLAEARQETSARARAPRETPGAAAGRLVPADLTPPTRARDCAPRSRAGCRRDR